MEEDILVEAINKFEKTIEGKFFQVELTPDQASSGLITIRTKKVEKNFQIEIKRNINNAVLASLDQQLKADKQTTLLVTRYVNPPMAEKLKALSIQFLDTAGNAYLNFSSVFVFIRGSKPTAMIQSESITRAFNPTGLKVVFALLSSNELPSVPLRTLAEAANVSLGSVQWTIRDLRRLGYLKDMGKKGKRLINKSELLTRWIQHYSEQLRPKLIVGKFRSNEANWWQNTMITKFDALWGGEVAGNLITRNLKPEIVTIYTYRSPGDLVAANKLRKDGTGNIEIVNTFWNPEFIKNNMEIVHPFLVYADLVSSGDERNLEIANQIYNERIVELIGED